MDGLGRLLHSNLYTDFYDYFGTGGVWDLIFTLNYYNLENLLNVYKTGNPKLFARSALNLLPNAFCEMAAEQDYNLMQNATAIQNFYANATCQNLLAHIETLLGTQVQALVLDDCTCTVAAVWEY